MDVEKCAAGSTPPPPLPSPRGTELTGQIRNHLNNRHRNRIGQWNVRGLSSLGKLSIPGKEMERLAINNMWIVFPIQLDREDYLLMLIVVQPNKQYGYIGHFCIKSKRRDDNPGLYTIS